MGFGAWSINEICFDYIREILPEGKIILELGSGYGTFMLAQHYTMYSIENYIEWIFKYDSTYIYAPIKIYDSQTDHSVHEFWDGSTSSIPRERGWYDPDIVKNNLPKNYDLILIDGPNNGLFGRSGFYKYFDWFKSDVPMVFDDVNVPAVLFLMQKIAEKLNKKYIILEDKATGVIL